MTVILVTCNTGDGEHGTQFLYCLFDVPLNSPNSVVLFHQVSAVVWLGSG